MSRARATLSLLIVAAWGCGVGEDEPGWVGSYAASGTWNISGPLAQSRTVGDAVADLLVDQIVSLCGVPSMLEDKAHEYVGKAIRDPVKTVVDQNAPSELAPGGSVNQVLAASLVDVKAESEITLEEGLLPGDMKGNESVTALEYTYQSKAYRVSAKDLAGAAITAEWEGEEDGASALEVDPHGVSIRYGELVRRIADHVVDAAGLTSLKDQVTAAVSCDQIVLQISGGQGLTISLSGWSHTVGEDDLKKACASASTLLESYVLGMFALDSKLEVGGTVTWDSAGLKSGSGFGGIVTIAPRAIAPRITVSFTADRM